MSQAPFDYDTPANDTDGGISLAIYSDRPHILAQLREIAANANLLVLSAQPIDALLKTKAPPRAEIVLVDCPQADAASLAALSLLDIHAAQAGIHLIIATTLAALDDVFGCLDQSGAQLLVDAAGTDFILALARVRAFAPAGRVRDLREEDRVLLLRLTEQVNAIATRLDRLDSQPPKVSASLFPFRGAATGDEPLVAKQPPSMPEASKIREILRHRRLRGQFFEAELFADPAWDMLLDLAAAQGEKHRVSVTSLCIAAAVPPTTALRWIGQMITAGLFQRTEDPADRRRAFIELTAKARDALAYYFAALGKQAVPLV